MKFDIKVEKIIMSAESAENSTVEIKVYLDDEQGESGGGGGKKGRGEMSAFEIILTLVRFSCNCRRRNFETCQSRRQNSYASGG